MKILNILNPSSWIGQIIVLGFFVAIGVIIGLKMQVPCPPTTVISNDIKAKKGAVVETTSTIEPEPEPERKKKRKRER
jgi:hypothetical protein